MRIWTIAPQYLDTKGLLSVWRETLLAKHVLENKTKGYKNHPQLIRFKNCKYPLYAINKYLEYIYLEAKERGYDFSEEKFVKNKTKFKIPVTKGQINFEFNHLLNKLKLRDIERYKKIKDTKNISIVPIFLAVEGDIEEWEITK